MNIKFHMPIFLSVILFWAVTVQAADGPDYLSPFTVTADSSSQTLYVAEATANQVVAYDVAGAKISRKFSLPGSPSGVALADEGKVLLVTIAQAEGEVWALDSKTGRKIFRVAVGHTPISPLVSPDGKLLYVCNRFSNTVSIIDIASHKVVDTVPVTREPIDSVVTADHKYLMVVSHLPNGASDGDYVTAYVDVIDLATRKKVKSIDLPNGAISLRSICLSPDGKYAYVPHILARFQVPTTQLERGWINTNALAIIDVAQQKLLNSVILDDVDLGAANPWDCQCSSDGKYICVTIAGTNEVIIIDRQGMHKKLAQAAQGQQVTSVTSSAKDVPNDLGFLTGIKKRYELQGKGPRGMALLGGKVYAAEYFTDSLACLGISLQLRPSDIQDIALGPKLPLTQVRKGEIFFHDASLCLQKWLSCSSCHPDVRTDGLNWDLLNDGMGNSKNTKSLLLAHQTPPAMITGVRANAKVAVRAGLRYIQFSVRPEEDAQALDAYLQSVKPLPSPYLVNGKLSAAAQRGKVIFEEKAFCNMCHSGPNHTDLKLHDVGTGKGYEEGTKFDTPTLVEAWRTAPYLYDGRAATIKDMLTKFNQKNMHGDTAELSEQEINDLAEYVLSL